MESDRGSTSAGSPDSTFPPKTDQNYTGMLEQTKQQFDAWCETRPDISSLSLESVYDEIRLVNFEKNCLWTWPKDHDTHGLAKISSSSDATAVSNRREILRPWQGMLGTAGGDPDTYGSCDENQGEMRWGDFCQAVVGLFDARVHSLRSTAMELSRGGIRPLKVTDLPWDILRSIFDWLQCGSVNCHGRAVCWADYEDEYPGSFEQRQAISDARLACRLFCDLASPHLIPVLRLELNQFSLDLADKISRVPRIAAGVRGINLSLAYCPKDLADDVSKFSDARLARLQLLEDWCHGQLRRWRVNTGSKNNRADYAKNRIDRLEEAIGNMACLRHEWGLYLDLPIEETLSESQEILRRGHDEFRRLHQEQRRLLGSGVFARSLASAVARMGNVRSLRLVTDVTDEHDHEFFRSATAMLTDPELLARYLVTPLSWGSIEENKEEPAELPCVKVLWELPIALHKAGAPLTELALTGLPIGPNSAMLCPRNPDDPEKVAWGDLSAACEKLEGLEISKGYGNRLNAQYDDIPRAERVCVDKFIASVLARCGDRLRRLDFDFDIIGAFPIWYHAGPAFAALRGLSRAQRLVLRGIELRQAELEGLFRKIDHMHCTALHIDGIRLRDGCWAGPIDVLHKKFALAKRKACREPVVSMRRLLNGEFGSGRPRGWHLHPLVHTFSVTELLTETERYVKGEREDNPLRDPAVQSMLGTP